MEKIYNKKTSFTEFTDGADRHRGNLPSQRCIEYGKKTKGTNNGIKNGARLVSKHSIEVNVLSAPGGPDSVTNQVKVHCGTFGTSSNNSYSIR